MSDKRWEHIYNRWPDISYRLQNIVYDEANAESPWIAFGEGYQLEFRRVCDWSHHPVDLERLRLNIDSLGRLQGVQRAKVIQVESGRSMADLERMLKAGYK